MVISFRLFLIVLENHLYFCLLHRNRRGVSCGDTSAMAHLPLSPIFMQGELQQTPTLWSPGLRLCPDFVRENDYIGEFNGSQWSYRAVNPNIILTVRLNEENSVTAMYRSGSETETLYFQYVAFYFEKVYFQSAGPVSAGSAPRLSAPDPNWGCWWFRRRFSRGWWSGFGLWHFKICRCRCFFCCCSVRLTGLYALRLF